MEHKHKKECKIVMVSTSSKFSYPPPKGEPAMLCTCSPQPEEPKEDSRSKRLKELMNMQIDAQKKTLTPLFISEKPEGWEVRFDKMMEPPLFLPGVEGKDCIMCGHPVPNSRGARLLKSFISALLKDEREK